MNRRQFIKGFSSLSLGGIASEVLGREDSAETLFEGFFRRVANSMDGVPAPPTSFVTNPRDWLGKRWHVGCCQDQAYAVQYLAKLQRIKVKIWVGQTKGLGTPVVHVVPVLMKGNTPYLVGDANAPDVSSFSSSPFFEPFGEVSFPGPTPDYDKATLPVIAWSASRKKVVFIGDHSR